MIVFLAKLLFPLFSPVMVACVLLAGAIAVMRSRPRAARAALVSALLIVFLGGNTWVSSMLAGLLEAGSIADPPPQPAQAIVVLSSDVQPAAPPQPTVELDNATANRLLYAAQLYRQRLAPEIILSGGHLAWLDGDPPMSQSMADVIELLGVPRSAIIQENHSANTYENALDVKAILKARGIDRVLLVTSAMHMPRALALFRHQGINAIPAPCDFVSLNEKGGNYWQELVIGLIPTANNLSSSTMALKEIGGLAIYRAAGLL